MELALRMGRTLSELRQSMTVSELLMWAEFDRESPVSEVRSDIRNAQLVSAIYGSQGVKIGIDEALLKWGGEQAAEGERDPFAGLESALMAAAQ